jgi:hypothetical protein
MNAPESHSAELSRLIARLTDGELSPDEARRLNELLHADPAAQEAYLDHLAMDAMLEREYGGAAPAFARSPAPRELPRSRGGLLTRLGLRSLFRAPVFAGMALGGLSASAVWAYAVPRFAELAVKLLPLANPGFEAAATIPPEGLPKVFGEWSGDYNTVVGAENGIAPREGDRMLRFLRADDVRTAPGSVSLSSEMWQIIDVAELRKTIGSGPATLEFSACFNSIPENTSRFSCGLSIHAFRGDLKDAHALWRSRVNQALSSGAKEEVLEPNGGEWRRVATQIVLPTEATLLLVQLRMRDRTNDLSKTTEFPGHYADACSLRLIQSTDPR